MLYYYFYYVACQELRRSSRPDSSTGRAPPTDPSERGRTMQVAVVGAGAWGASVAAEFAARGHSARLVDVRPPGHRLSASSGPTRMWRVVDPMPHRAAMSVAAIRAMEDLQTLDDQPIFRRCGLLWRDDDDELSSLAESLDAVGASFEEVGPAGVAGYFAGLGSTDRGALFQHEAGVLFAPAMLRAHLRRFARAGGTLQLGRRVSQIRSTAGGVEVGLEDGPSLDADVVVIAAGAGTRALAASVDVALPLTTYTEQVVTLERREESGDLPCLFDRTTPDTIGLYGMPADASSFKVGIDRFQAPISPESDDRTAHPQVTREIVDGVVSRTTAISDRIVETAVCTWTGTPDDEWIIDHVVDGVFVACGDNGVGFKYSPLIGRIVADRILGTPSDFDLSRFRIDRQRTDTHEGAPHARRPA